MHLPTLLAAAALVLTASQAEARARGKVRSSAPSPVAHPAAPVTATPASAGGVVPGAVVGAAIGSRSARAGSRDDVPTASTTRLDIPPYVPMAVATSSSKVSAEPPSPCAEDRVVGRGIGFCSLN